MFLLGVTLGVVVFAETEPLFSEFWLHSGDLGRLTLPDVFGLPTGVVVLAIVVMALGAFGGAEWAEARFRKKD